jgi:hypothetical protein
MKTEQLFKKYYRILNEQEPAEQAVTPSEAAPADMAPPSEPAAPIEPEVPPLDENEKHVIKILTNSFIFNPTLFDKNKQKFIYNKIDKIKRSVNIPVASIIDEIKSILNLDTSLRVESKTLKLLDRYMLMIEQPADATEPQSDNQQTERQPVTAATPDIEKNENKLNLAEIFPLYKELIIQSLLHAPTDEELIILKPIVNKFSESDPEKIVTTVKDLLGQESDIDLESDLANA